MHYDFICGLHVAQSQLTHQPEHICEVWVQASPNPRLQSVVEQLQLLGVRPQQASAKTLAQKVNGQPHQGIVLRVKSAPHFSEHDLADMLDKIDVPFLLILDGVTDPHNLGACLRSASAAGVDAVIAPKNNSASLNATVHKVACGAARTTPFIQVTNLARTLRALKTQGVWVVGAAGEGEQSLYTRSLTGALAVVMGAEEKGLRRLTRECCDQLLNIPMFGHMSSLNVSVATGVFLFECVRQRQEN